MSALRGIYVIANEGAPDPVDVARSALNGGARIIQYRAKNGANLAQVQRLRKLTKDAGTLLIVNDWWELAVESGADGVHLGPDDAVRERLPEIRRRLGSLLLGLSCGTPAEARAAEAAGADYIGVGSVFATQSKADAGAPIGIRGLLDVAAATTLPVAAIGGISAANVHEVAASGVAMAAVISAVARACDMRAATEALVQVWAAR